jgi:hypothetical protein
MTKNVLSGQRLVLIIRGLCSDFSVAKGVHQTCAISDLRALPAGLLNSTVNIIGELFYRMNCGFCEAETQTWKSRSIFKRHQRGISRQFVSVTRHQQFDLESLLPPYRISLLTLLRMAR